MNAYAVILAGGKGERFWPLSTAKKPKQLLSLVGDRSLLAQAVLRLEGLVPPERIFVLTNADLVDACRVSVPELPPAQIVGEPVGRDTAAAVALGTALVRARDPDAVFAILTADHVMGDLPLFRDTLASAFQIAGGGDHLVTIGIRPTEASTAYGYIERGEPFREINGIRFFRTVRFVEKPPADKAREYVAAGSYAWNSGMFVWSVASISRAFRAHRPPLAEMIDALVPHCGRASFDAELRKAFEPLQKISIDYAVMEKSSNIVVAEGTFAWDDVGSWTALRNHFPRDASGNTVIGEGYAVDTKDNIVFSKDRVTALVGVEDLIVVQAEGATLVCHRDRAQDVKKLLAEIRERGAAARLL